MSCGCKSDFSNCFQVVSDQCVKYTGPEVECLGICPGNTLSEIEAIVFDKLCDMACGDGISLCDLDYVEFCDYLQKFLSNTANDKTLIGFATIVLNAICDLDSRITTLTEIVNTFINMTFDTRCLGKGTTLTLQQIIQQLIDDDCDHETRITILENAINNLSTTIDTAIGNYLRNHIKSCQTGNITFSGTGANTDVSFKGFLPVGGIMMYAGPTNYFDSTGLGITGTPMCGMAICNSQNGTLDMRGFVPAGAVTGFPGSTYTLNALVDPANNNGDGNYYPGDTGGEIKHLLAPQECATPAHGHNVNEHGGHFHYMHFGLGTVGTGNGGGSSYIKADSRQVSSSNPDTGGYNYPGPVFIGIEVDRATTGITIDPVASAPAQNKHENRMPYKAVIYIQRIS